MGLPECEDISLRVKCVDGGHRPVGDRAYCSEHLWSQVANCTARQTERFRPETNSVTFQLQFAITFIMVVRSSVSVNFMQLYDIKCNFIRTSTVQICSNNRQIQQTKEKKRNCTQDSEKRCLKIIGNSIIQIVLKHHLTL